MLHPIPVSKGIFHRWGIDLIGPLAETRNGNRYIVVATEYLTQWPEAAPIAEKTVAAVGKVVMEKIFYRYFAPKYILSDQGNVSF